MRFASCLLYFFLVSCSWANQVQVAVAANFATPMKHIVVAFQKTTGYQVALSVGATSKLYAQIKNGAPFDLLLAADQSTPTRLAREDIAIPNSQFTYAVGKLVLWSTTKKVVDATVLKQGDFAYLAITSAQAPYGVAAKQTLVALNLFDALTDQLVRGESVSQAYSFVATGNAELGFVALSQVWENNQIKSGSAWIVPENLYTPLRQDAILLRHGETNPAARALLAYLKSLPAQNVIRSYGYQ